MRKLNYNYKKKTQENYSTTSENFQNLQNYNIQLVEMHQYIT